MANLYEVANDFIEAYNLLDQAETDEEYQSALAIFLQRDKELSTKIENFVYYLKNTEGEAVKFKAEENRLKERRQILERKVKDGKDFIKNVLIGYGIDSIDAGMFKVKVQNNSQYSVIVEDETKIPKEYFINQPVLDKKALKEAMVENGEVIKGASVERGTHLRIR